MRPRRINSCLNSAREECVDAQMAQCKNKLRLATDLAKKLHRETQENLKKMRRDREVTRMMIAKFSCIERHLKKRECDSPAKVSIKKQPMWK
jgi:hypothetical protein